MTSRVSAVLTATAHPSPHEGRVGPFALWFGVVGAPLAWALQQLVTPPIFAHGCYPHDVPISEPIWSNAAAVATTIELVALFACVAAGLISWRNWQRAGAEKAGSAHHLLEGGDGRTRFMSMVGMISSGLFLLAVIFALTAFYLVAGCNG
jgi:hypothetical protein